MTNSAIKSLKGVDVIAMVIDASQKLEREMNLCGKNRTNENS